MTVGASARTRIRRSAAVVVTLLVAGASAAGSARGEETPSDVWVARGDAAWDRRADGQRDGRARAEPIGDAVIAYQEAVDADASRLDALWKLLRAIHFQSEFADCEEGERQRTLARGMEQAQAAEARLAALAGLHALVGQAEPARVADALRTHPEAAPVAFWSAVVTAAWARTAGAVEALRRGLALTLRRHAELVIALDPAYEAGGAYRLLGRIHAEVPRIPLVTGWVERERAVAELERALAVDPNHPWNQLLLGQTLLELAPAERGRALGLLQRVATGSPRPGYAVEDEALGRQARDVLARAGGG